MVTYLPNVFPAHEDLLGWEGEDDLEGRRCLCGWEWDKKPPPSWVGHLENMPTVKEGVDRTMVLDIL